MSDDAADWRMPPPSDNRDVLVWITFMHTWWIGNYSTEDDRYHFDDHHIDKQKRYVGAWHELPKAPTE